MGVNAVTSVPTYTDGEILEASRLNVTNSGIPVFATTTTRDAGFGGTGEKVLAEGQMAYIENIAGSSAVQYYDGSAWKTLVTSGLTLISTTTIGSAVSSVTISDVFSSSYDNYRITLNNTTGSTSLNTRLQLTGLTSGSYNNSAIYINTSGTVFSAAGSGATTFLMGAADTGNANSSSIDLFGPFLTTRTGLVGMATGDNLTYIVGGQAVDTTSRTGFTIFTSAGTITGGTIRVYGYQNS